jgi:hypothetical protein
MAVRWREKKRNKREREIDDEIVADGRAYLPRANTIKVFSFFLAPPSTYTYTKAK